MNLPEPKLPPMFTGYAVNAPLRPLAEACRGAQAGTYGAGDLIWARALDQMSLALVLEPDVPLAAACQMNALAHVAIAETLGHLCPPRVAILSRWPGTVLTNGAACGAVMLAASTSDLAEIPRWLVIGIDLTIRADRRVEPGERPDETSLGEEGTDVTRTDLVEALATRLLAWLHTWQTEGFRHIHDPWLFRAEGREEVVRVDGTSGRVIGLDDAGNLLLKPSDGGPIAAFALLPHVQVHA
jgi:BirA family transcriptional regulator, biotin operon repressor / biotin---[acetyl-CoA-carboxylase] ligase